MKKAAFFIFCLCFILASVVSAQNSGTVKGNPRGVSKKKPRADSTGGHPANVTALRLNHTEISSACPDDAKECSSSPMIEVATTATYSETGLYVYKVSGGTIVGSGANVIWDLSAVPPGEYSITAGIDTGKPWGVVGMTQTRLVRVLDCMGCKSEIVNKAENK